MSSVQKEEMSYIEKVLRVAEVKLTLCMLKEVINYDVVINKMQKISFNEPTCNKMVGIMEDMYTKLGYSNIDRVSLVGYCDRVQYEGETRKTILNTFDTIHSFIKTENSLDFDGIFEEYSMISSVYKFSTWVTKSGGIDEVTSKLLKLKNMDEINQVIEGRLLEFFNTGTADASILDTDMTEMIDDKFIEGIQNKDEIIETVPLLNQFYILNKVTKGFVRGLTGFGGASGLGKSSFMYSVYVMSMLENSKSKICIYANEQTAKVFAMGMFFAFISQVFNMKQEEFKNTGTISLSRDRFISGAFNEDETKKLVSIIKIFRARYKNRVTHSYFDEMSPNNLRRDVRKKVRSGHKFFFYDTFKDPDEDYSKMMKLASTFDQLTKKYNIHAYASLQLADESNGVKYLNNKHLASAKGVKRVMDTLLLMRKLDVEELTYLKVHKLGHKDQTIGIDLSNEHYYALFIDKNRNGSSDMVVLYQVYLDILKYKEIGVISSGIPKEDFRFKKKK